MGEKQVVVPKHFSTSEELQISKLVMFTIYTHYHIIQIQMSLLRCRSLGRTSLKAEDL